MKIDDKDLDGFSSEIVTQCMATRRDRINMYNGLMHYYLFGAAEGHQAMYGKIFPHIDLLTSYVYSQATVKYDVAVENVEPTVYKQADLISARANTYFHDMGVADMFGDALRLAFVWSSALIKFNSRAKPFTLEPYIIQPHNFGVMDESVNMLDRQEAFVEAYTISKSELRRRVSVLPNGADIMRRVISAPINEEEPYPDSIHRIIVAGPSNLTGGTTRGIVNIPELFNQLQYKPKSIEDQVEMYELNVWDDDKEDYRTVTLAAPGVVIYGRKDIGNITGMQGEHSYVHLCPNRMHNYFYGWSEVTNLLRLQDWLSERLGEIRKIMTLQANPPKSFSGFGGINDEKMAAMNTPGAYIGDPTPSAKVENLAPNLPNGLFEEVYAIQGFYNDISGIDDILQGKGAPGVRSKAQTDTLAKLGSARIKQRAQMVERSLEEVGDLVVKMMRKKDDHRYFLEPDKQDGQFAAAQFTEDFRVHVDAHSASPVFVDDHKQLAFALAKAQAIGPEDLLKLTNPPGLGQLQQNLKKKQEEQAAKFQQMLAAGMVQPGGKKGLKAA